MNNVKIHRTEEYLNKFATVKYLNNNDNNKQHTPTPSTTDKHNHQPTSTDTQPQPHTQNRKIKSELRAKRHQLRQKTNQDTDTDTLQKQIRILEAKIQPLPGHPRSGEPGGLRELASYSLAVTHVVGSAGTVPLHPRSGGVGHQPVTGHQKLNHGAFTGAAGQPRRTQKTDKTQKRITKYPPAETKTGPHGNPDTHFKRRNTKRGIRKEETKGIRNRKRSLKRNIARRLHRSGVPMALRAQDPLGVSTKAKTRDTIAYMELLHLATLNAQGINKLEGRLLIEKYMDQHNIDVMFVQDTKVKFNQKERKTKYTWFNSGENPIYSQKPFSSGVAFVIRNTYLNYIKEITPVNDRIITMTLYAAMPITFISAYAPTADKTTEQKEKFYKPLIKEIEKAKKKGPVYVGGDFNARVQMKANPEEYGIGYHVFDPEKITLEDQLEPVAESREMFVNMLSQTDTLAMNTFFQKPNNKLLTYHMPTNNLGPPYKRGIYEQIDYCLTTERWKNSVLDAESDVHANINSDHYPIRFKVKVKFRRKTKEEVSQNKRAKFEPCGEELNEEINRDVYNIINEADNLKDWKEKCKKLVNEKFPKKPERERQEDISEETLELISLREFCIGRDEHDDAKFLTKMIRKSRRKDKERATLDTLRNDLDVKDKWMGLKKLKKKYVPIPYFRKTKEGVPIKRTEQAQKVAEFLRDNIWGLEQNIGKDKTLNKEIINKGLNFKLSPFEMQELEAAIKKLKRNRAPGPDELTSDFFKELDYLNKIYILNIINKWWIEEKINEEELMAHVVMIFKKGDTSDLTNYRPISLLNTLYKLLAGMLQKRIEKEVDQYIQPNQYGFRKGKSTTDAVHAIRRVMEYGEKTGNREILVLLDWEKAFDKVTHEALFTALERIGIDPKYIRIIKEIYKNPLFNVKFEGQTSETMRQETGIRQGCPLSPYLFTIVMSVLFWDVKKERELSRKLRENRVPGASFDEVLYADDTILISTDTRAINEFLKEIETQGEKIGMKLNKDKTEVIVIGKNKNAHIKFKNGTPVKRATDAKYLGVDLNERADPNKELRLRISNTMSTWKKWDYSLKRQTAQ